jgi:hypothetical protein
VLVATHKYTDESRDFTAYLNNWSPVTKALAG